MEELSSIADNIKGGAKLVDCFGYWPSFHDAEILEVLLRSTGTSEIKIRTMSSKFQIDARNHVMTEKDIVVSFIITNIKELALRDFSPQNIIMSLNISQSESGFELTLDGSTGMSGHILATDVEIEISPDSQQLADEQ